jgi:DNA-binding CsgD family transcriptional regulator
MKVSGTVLLTRKVLVTQRFGADAWHGLFRDTARSHASFRQPITMTSMIPLPEFLAFHDELVHRFYPDRRQALLDLGAEVGRWVHTEGPLSAFVPNADITSIVEAMPKLWLRYFAETDSSAEAILRDAGIEFRVRDLPAWHPYFEYLVIGYQRELLELYCANPVSAHRLSAGRGRTYAYLLATNPIPGAGPSSERRRKNRGRALGRSTPITERELEVLKLVALGKTNREIAFLLQVSPKTVEHHISHAYDKLGLYSRAGAATWLADRSTRPE